MNLSSFPNMMGGGPMSMPQQQPKNQPQANQAAQAQMQAELIRNYAMQQQQMPPGDWRHSVTPKERAGSAMELRTCLSLAKPDMSMQAALQACSKLEYQALASATDKNTYMNSIRKMLQNFTEARSRNAAQNMSSMQQMQAMQQSPAMMTQKRMALNQASQGQPFPAQLQHQMQASPLPMNAQNLMSITPSAMGNAQILQQTNQPPQQGASGVQQSLSPAENAQINALATKLMHNAPKERIEQIQMKFRNLSQENQDMVMQKYGNPLTLHFRQEAQKIWMAQRSRHQSQAQNGNQRANGAGVNAAMAQNPVLLRNAQQAGNPQAMSGATTGQDFDISQIAGQQADAMRSQDAGQLVVPASNNNLNMNQQVSGMQLGVNQTAAFAQQGMGVNGQVQNGLQLQPNFINQQQAQQAQTQMRMRLAQQHGLLNQRPANQQANARMSMNAPMVGMGSQAPQPNPMSLLTQPVSQPNQRNGAAPQHLQSTMTQLPQAPNQPDPRALQALQEAQVRANSLAAAGQPFQGNVRRQLPAFVQGLADNVKNSLLSLPEDAYQLAIQRLQEQRMGAGFPGALVQNLQRGQIPTPQPQNLGQVPPPGMAAGNQQPGPMANQAQMPGNAMNEQAQLQRLQHQVLEQYNLPPQILHQLDMKQFPPSFIHANNLSIPDHVRTWGQLKLWVLQNRASVPQTITVLRVLQMQLRFLQQQQNAAQGRMNPAQNGGVMPQPGLTAQQSMPGPGIPNIQPQQQIPPTNTPQSWQALSVGPEEMMAFRQRFPQAQSLTEDQLRQLIQRNKFEKLQKARLQQQQQQQQQQLQAAQQNQTQQQQQFTQPNNVQQMQMPPQAPQPQRPMLQMPQQAMPPQRTPSQPPQQRPGMPPGANIAMPTPQMSAPRQPSITGKLQGVKRPAPDDLETAQPVPSAAQMQHTMSQQRTPAGTGQPQPKVQQAGAGANAPFPPKPNVSQEELDRRWQLLLKQSEDPNNVPKRPPGPIPPEARQRLVALLKDTARVIPELDDCLKTFFMNTGDEKQTKQFFKARQVLRENVDFKDFSLVQNLTQSPKIVGETIEHIQKFVFQVTKRFKQAKARGRASTGQDATGVVAPPNQQQLLSGAQNEAITAQQQMSNSPAQLNSVNLQHHTQQHATRRPNIKPPAAPTTGPGQFHPFEASPVREPKYAAGLQKVRPEDLHLPAKKKQKTGPTATPLSTATQPAPTAQASPQVGKAPSPEVQRKLSEVKVEIQKPVMPFKCGENGCDKSFATQVDLDAHKKDDHVVIKDFVKYALENLAESIGLNKDGTPKTPGTAGKDAESKKASAMTPAGSTKLSDAGKKDSPSVRASQAGKNAKGDGATDKLGGTTLESDRAADVDDPWANSPLKPAEIAEIFHPVDTLISQALHNFNPTRDELINAGIIMAGGHDDQPPTPSPDDVPDLSDPNTTPSPASKDTSTVTTAAAPSLDLPSWVGNDWTWPTSTAKQWDDESVYLEPVEDAGAEGGANDAAADAKAGTSDVDALLAGGADLGLWNVDWLRSEVFVGPTAGHPDDVVPLSERLRALRDERRTEAQRREDRERELCAKDPERARRWLVEEQDRNAKKMEEVERLRYLKNKDVPGWDDVNMDDFVSFDH